MDIDDLMADDEEYRGASESKTSSMSMDEFSDLFEEASSSDDQERHPGDADDDGENGAGEEEEKEKEEKGNGRTLVGSVEKFFSKIKVAAISVTGDIAVGDSLIISGDNGDITLKVSQMQINRENVESAKDGDSIGIKVRKAVSPGSKVYRL